MTLSPEIAAIYKRVALQNVAAYDAWRAAMTPEARAEHDRKELESLRAWDRLTPDQKAARMIRQMRGDL